MFFNLKKKFSTNKVGGEISYYNLTDWWLNLLTDEERKIIKTIYNPISTSSDKKCIDEGNINNSSHSKLLFLGCLASWFTKPEYYTIGKKILLEGERCINETNNILDKHFFYLSGIKIHYANREKDSNALNFAIEYCKKQISIAKEAKKEFLKEYPSEPLPSHTGYKQLAIIYDKQKKYTEALEITRQALCEGWNDDCQKRIDRLEKKIAKTNTK